MFFNRLTRPPVRAGCSVGRSSATLGTVMLIATIALAAVTLAQQPADEAPTPDLAVISARQGACSADFTVKDSDGEPIYAATIHVRLRYGFLGIKRMDLEVGTNADGEARVEGLPSRARPLTYDIWKADKKTTVEQDPSTDCRATYEISLE